MISAEVILDSINPLGERLTTMECTFHRFILAEVNTHRVFSRNSASSRARPLRVTLEEVRNNPAYPAVWRKEKPGMSGGADLDGHERRFAQNLWKGCKDDVLILVGDYLDSCAEGSISPLHKSWLNRLLEPFMWHTAVISSTEWDNFFKQRLHPDAQPEFMLLAEKMKKALDASTPVSRTYHLPYISTSEYHSPHATKMSVARCARVTNLLQGGERELQDDLNLYNKLLNADPPHWSPFEHVAYYSEDDVSTTNFTGSWIQLRQMLTKEMENGH